jgi:hypothetical protein
MPLKPFLTSWDRITVTKCLSMGVSSSNAIWIGHASEWFSVVFFSQSAIFMTIL